jgi:hypothetical protein
MRELWERSSLPIIFRWTKIYNEEADKNDILCLINIADNKVLISSIYIMP